MGCSSSSPAPAPHAATGEPTPIDAGDLNAALFRTTSGIQGDHMLSRVTPNHGEWGLEVAGDEGALMAYLTQGRLDR